MKRCMLLNVLLWVLGVSAFAQTQGIAFETSKSWKKVIFGKSAKNLDKKLTIGAAHFIIVINEYCRCEVIEHGCSEQGVASGH